MAEVTKQANFRLSTKHIDIINQLAGSEHVTKAAVVEHALDLLKQRVDSGERVYSSNGGGRTKQANFRLSVRHVQIIDELAAREHVTKATIVERALEIAQEAVAAGGSISSGGHRNVRRNGPVRIIQGNTALKVEEEPEETPVIPYVSENAQPQAEPQQEPEAKTAAEVKTEPAEAKETPAQDAKTEEESENKEDKPSKRKASRNRKAAQEDSAAVPVAQPVQQVPAYPLYAQPGQQVMAPAAAFAPQGPAYAPQTPAITKTDVQAAVLEERLNGQIEALKQSLEAKDARIDALLKQMDERKQDDKDARFETLIAQIAKNSDKPVSVEMPAPAAQPAPQQQSDPRIDAILRQLESQKQDDQTSRLESLIRELAAKNNQPVAPAPAAPSRNDEILQIINALKPAQQGSDATYQIEAARSAGREEGRREAEAEVNRRLDDLRREYERKIDAARTEGYEAGKKEVSADTEKLLAEARTSGAFYERAKIANMRGLCFGEKRRYLKVHVTM